jgi:hypothetical protein
MQWIHLLYIEQAESHVVYFRVLQGHFRNCQFSPSLCRVGHALEAHQVSSHYQGIENAWWLWQGRQAWHASDKWRLHHTLAQWTFDLGFVRRERFASWAHTLTKSLMQIRFKEITLFIPLFLTNNYWWVQFSSGILRCYYEACTYTNNVILCSILLCSFHVNPTSLELLQTPCHSCSSVPMYCIRIR